MAIVYYKNSKTNRTYAYESEAIWDPEKGYSVPKRKYLGRVDPETNEIIKSDGKRGRKPSDTSADQKNTTIGNDLTKQLQSDNAALKQEVRELKKQVKNLQEQNDSLNKAILKSLDFLSSSLK